MFGERGVGLVCVFVLNERSVGIHMWFYNNNADCFVYVLIFGNV